MWHSCGEQEVLMLIFMLRLSGSLYKGSLFSFTTQPRLWVFTTGRCIWSLAPTLFLCSLQDATHSQSPLTLNPSQSLASGNVGAFGLNQMSLNWFVMTEWSKLLHQLNSIWPSLKDPVKLVHIYHPSNPGRSWIQSSAGRGQPLTASVPFIGSSGELSLETANWKHTCLQWEREAAPTGPTSTPQPDRGRWKWLRSSILQNRDDSCLCDQNTTLNQRYLWQPSQRVDLLFITLQLEQIHISQLLK